MTEKSTVLDTEYAEICLLSGLIKYQDYIPRVLNILPDDSYFTKTEYREIYTFIRYMYENFKTWDIGTLVTELKTKNKYSIIGGFEILDKITSHISFNPMYEAEILRQAHKRRQVLTYAASLVSQVHDTTELAELLANAKHDLDEVLSEAELSSSMTLLADAFKTLSLQSNEEFIQTRLESLDRYIHGYGVGNFVIVAGRPGMGKTSFLMLMVKSLIKDNVPVGLFSMEMPKTELFRRLIYSDCLGVPLYYCYQKFLTQTQIDLLKYSKDALEKCPLVIDDARSLTPQLLRSRIHAMKQTYGVQVVFIDYLQLLNPDTRSKSKYEEVTDLSRKIKTLAMDFEMPVICACQLNRASELRTDKIPRMSDLRDSGAIEQDADVIMLLHRPPYYYAENEKENRDMDAAQIFISKNRRGATGMIEGKFFGEHCRYEV